MSYCINPNCFHRENLDTEEICRCCGTQLYINNRYQLIQPLRSLNFIGYTEIFEIKDRGEIKVLKTLKTDEESSHKLVQLFEQEARILINLNHDGIPKALLDGYFQFPLSNGQMLYCLVMEKIEGQNLEDWIKNNGYISEKRAIYWLKKITNILAEVHKHNFFHRDIKPSNIMRKPDGQMVLIDFGTARSFSQTVIAGRTITKIYSHGYTAPEQERGKAVPQSDFFALGRTFVHLLTRKPPEEELNWRENAIHISKDLSDLIDDLMAESWEDRPKNTEIILQRLEQMKNKIKTNKIRNINSINLWLLGIFSIFCAVIGGILGAFIFIKWANINNLDYNQKIAFNNKIIDTYVTVNANAGFQNSHIEVEPGQTVTLEPEGHIHLASDQLKNFVDVMKPLIVQGAPNRPWDDDNKKRYGKPLKFDGNNEFYRDWIAPGGESYNSPMLQECKLKKDEKWGSLMAIIIPKKDKNLEFSDISDPFYVLQAHNLNTSDIKIVSNKQDIPVEQKGWLTFIVNDAVISNHQLSSPESKEYYKAIMDSIRKNGLSKNSNHIINPSSVPLAFYYDNVGSFRVHVIVTK